MLSIKESLPYRRECFLQKATWRCLFYKRGPKDKVGASRHILDCKRHLEHVFGGVHVFLFFHLQYPLARLEAGAWPWFLFAGGASNNSSRLQCIPPGEYHLILVTSVAIAQSCPQSFECSRPKALDCIRRQCIRAAKLRAPDRICASARYDFA